jgi:hypothetical protein
MGSVGFACLCIGAHTKSPNQWISDLLSMGVSGYR